MPKLFESFKHAQHLVSQNSHIHTTSNRVYLPRPFEHPRTINTPGPELLLSPTTQGEACPGLAEAISNITATRGMSGETYIPGGSVGEYAQYSYPGYDFRPTDPRVERMLEDFERSEIEEWEFYTMQFYEIFGSRCNQLDAENELYDRLVSDAIMFQIDGGFQGRPLGEALLEDLERYEEEEEAFWMMRGIAQTYGLWDEEYFQTWRRGPWWKSTCHSGCEEIEANATFQPVHPRDIELFEKVLWWKMREHYEDGTPWQELFGCPNQCIEPQKPTHEDMNPAMSEGMEHLDPDDDDPASSRSECSQNSVYQDLPEEDPDWVKLDEREHIALPPSPSPVVETYFIEIPKILEPGIGKDESWALIVSS
ncbi:unnamed protein product [Tuber aestivum]|uniref:Uncharacterized protein n=1 Tax=Tuber aestivum TaxID=59557 RepID=A0A292Q4S0_9PEZI|nr:unnamed protein product [Tuber aestivum]